MTTIDPYVDLETCGGGDDCWVGRCKIMPVMVRGRRDEFILYFPHEDCDWFKDNKCTHMGDKTCKTCKYGPIVELHSSICWYCWAGVKKRYEKKETETGVLK